MRERQAQAEVHNRGILRVAMALGLAASLTAATQVAAQTARKAPPPVQPAAAETAGMPATVVDSQQIESVLGKPVRSPTGDDMGRIVDVLIDRTGDVRAAVIDFGGFFGVGSRKIAVDWRILHFSAEGGADAIAADLARDRLRVAPVYKEGDPVVILGPGPAAATPPGTPAKAAAAATTPAATTPAAGSSTPPAATPEAAPK